MNLQLSQETIQKTTKVTGNFIVDKLIDKITNE